jgi:hypothetical protein
MSISVNHKSIQGTSNKTRGNNRFTFPVGFSNFHTDERFNFQLNRPIALGLGRIEENKEAAASITDIPSFRHEMRRQGEKAYVEGRYFHAVGYFRVAEFLRLTLRPIKKRSSIKSLLPSTRQLKMKP